MIVDGTYTYKSALVLTPDLMTELDSYIKSKFSNPKYPTTLSYSSTLKNKSRMTFLSIEEMLGYDNSLRQKIESIKVESDVGTMYMTIEPEPAVIVSFKYTVEVRYTFKSTENELVFRDGLKKIFDKAKVPCAMLYKFAFMQIFVLLIAFTVVLLGITSINSADNEGRTITIRGLFISLSSGIVGGSGSYLFPKLWKCIFPPIVFLWGEEVKFNKRRTEIRKNVFWGIFVALIIGILTGLIVSIF